MDDQCESNPGSSSLSTNLPAAGRFPKFRKASKIFPSLVPVSAWNLLSRRWRCWQCQDEAEEWCGGFLGCPEIQVPLEIKSLQRSWCILLALKAGLSSSKKQTPSKKSTSATCSGSGIQDFICLKLGLFLSLVEKKNSLRKNVNNISLSAGNPNRNVVGFPSLEMTSPRGVAGLSVP